MKNKNTLESNLYKIYNILYKISPELHEVLQTEKLPVNSKIEKDQPGIYLVMVRVLNYDRNVLVYSYMYYHSLFEYSLISFLMSKFIYNSKYSEYKDTGEFLILFDDVFDKSYNISSGLS